MDHCEKRFATSALVAAAGCETGTFHKWRSRNGLFPETLGASGWNKFSAFDVCVVRAIVSLTERGMGAQDAVDLAQRELGAAILMLLDGEAFAPYAYFFKGAPGAKRRWSVFHADSNTTIASMEMALGGEIADEAGLFVNCRSIIKHVVDCLAAARSWATMPDEQARTKKIRAS